MYGKNYHILKRLSVTNHSDRPKTFILEPWANEYPIRPGETFIVEGEGPDDLALLEYEERDDYLIVYAWDGSDARIVRGDGTLVADWTGIRVPDSPRMEDPEEPDS
jgi:hypothetical protein